MISSNRAARFSEAAGLAAEARLFGRYLLGNDPPPPLVERYGEAIPALFPEPPGGADAALLGFVSRHPWSLAPLDAALGLLRPGALLRRRLVVMMAVLETDPIFVDRFESLHPGPAQAVARLAWIGTLAGIKFVAGLLLYPIARLSTPATPRSAQDADG
jgi:hypothetical protein